MAWLLLPIIIAFISVLAFFLLIALPMYVAQHPHFGAPFNIVIACALMSLMWFTFLSDGYEAMATFYNFPFHLFKSRRTKTLKAPMISMVLSYLYNIYTFAVIYAYISYVDNLSFGAASPLSTIDSIYFSVITSTTVGYGDIVPKSNAAKIFVMIQSLLNLVYVILLFSVCSGYLKEKRWPDTSDKAVCKLNVNNRDDI